MRQVDAGVVPGTAGLRKATIDERCNGGPWFQIWQTFHRFALLPVHRADPDESRHFRFD